MARSVLPTFTPRVKMGNTIQVSNRPDYMVAAGKMIQLMREGEYREMELLIGLFNEQERTQLLAAVAKVAADVVDSSGPARRRFSRRFGATA